MVDLLEGVSQSALSGGFFATVDGGRSAPRDAVGSAVVNGRANQTILQGQSTFDLSGQERWVRSHQGLRSVAGS